MLKRIAITTVAAAALFSAATLAAAPFAPAAAQASITFGSPPPPPLYEAVPQQRPGYVWAPGHYRLLDNRYVWNAGQWQAGRWATRTMTAAFMVSTVRATATTEPAARRAAKAAPSMA